MMTKDQRHRAIKYVARTLGTVVIASFLIGLVFAVIMAVVGMIMGNPFSIQHIVNYTLISAVVVGGCCIIGLIVTIASELLQELI